MEKTIVSKLDEKTLMYSDVVWDYYLRNWKFSTINYKDQFVNIPILKEASHIIEKQNDSYPWKSYIDGFISEYSKPLARDLELTVHLSQVQPNPPLPVAPGGFSSSNAIDYGIKMARAFKVWEYIAEKLPEYEKLKAFKASDWSKLYNNMIKQYFVDVSQTDFNEVMDFKQKPNGSSRIKWIGKKNEAMYFQNKYGFTVKEFNQCFVYKDGSNFKENNRTDTDPKNEFTSLLT